jgi:hypothetical protein
MRALIVAILAACLCAEAAAQAPYSPPRTPDGQPDFQGYWAMQWTTPLERPPGVNQLVIDKAEAQKQHEAFLKRIGSIDQFAALDDWDFAGPLTIRGEARSSLVIDPPDGRLPYSGVGRALRAQFTTPFFGVDDPEQRSMTERCLMGGSGYAPFLAIPASNLRQVVQTRDTVLFYTESFAALRIIPTDGRTGPPIPRGGSSSGHWEGDTLVVETGGYLEGDRFRVSPGSSFPISQTTRVTERFTLLGPDEILYRYMVQDPSLYERAWTAETLMVRLRKVRIFEDACHASNYSLPGILAGARAEERRKPRR